MKLTRYFFKLAFGLVAALMLVNAHAVSVVEYRNKTLDAYFITGRVNEQQVLDGIADFVRTGMSFQAAAALDAPSALTKICRFYVNLVSPFVNSHFYGRQGIDCEAILAANVAGFNYEGYDFAVQAPVAGVGSGGATLVCPAGTLPVYRSFRALAGGKTSNHRYTVSTATYAAAATTGYVGEEVQFCVATVIDVADTWTGTASGIFESANLGETTTAELTWRLASVSGNIAVYKPSGTVRATIDLRIPSCTGSRLDPPTHTLDPAVDGTLTVNFNVNPPTFHGTGLSYWTANLVCNEGIFPGYEGQKDFFGGSGGAFGVEAAGTVSPDGTTIAGADTRSVVGAYSQTFQWKFTRNR